MLEAAAMAEYAETFVLDMGEPVQIVDLVHNYAEQLQLPNVEIRYTGLRPGEKLAEKVFSRLPRSGVPTAHPKIWATRRSEPPRDFAAAARAVSTPRLTTTTRASSRSCSQRLVPGIPARSDRKETLASVGAPYPDGF